MADVDPAALRSGGTHNPSAQVTSARVQLMDVGRDPWFLSALGAAPERASRGETDARSAVATPHGIPDPHEYPSIDRAMAFPEPLRPQDSVGAVPSIANRVHVAGLTNARSTATMPFSMPSVVPPAAPSPVASAAPQPTNDGIESNADSSSARRENIHESRADAPWHKRNVFFRETTAGTELVIRDYFAGDAENRQRLARLLEQLGHSGNRPDRIFINGKAVVSDTRTDANAPHPTGRR